MYCSIESVAEKGDDHIKMRDYTTRIVALTLTLILLVGCIAQSPETAPPESSSVDDVLATLEGLPINEFFEESYKQLLLRNPEYLTELGIAELYGVGNDQLTNISDVYIRETYELQKGILQLLREYDRYQLTREQQISYDVYEWFLDDVVRQHEFMYYDYPVTHFITGVQNQLIQFFTDIHPVTNKKDAEDYIARLKQVDIKFEQLIEGLTLREEAGIIPPKFIIQWSLYDVRRIASGSARYLPFYTAFEEKVNVLELETEEKQSLLEDAEKAINDSVIPAFQDLKDYLEHLESVAHTDDGVWQFHKGGEYYTYALRHHTTTDMTADEIHQLGLQEVERIHAEMRTIFDQLGYPEDESLSQLFDRVARDGGYVSGNLVVETYEALIEEADQNLDAAFDIRPAAEVIVIGGPIGGFYVPGSLDGSRPGAFYANVGGSEPLYGMPTLAYHEAVPGHHFQISLAQEMDLPFFRGDVGFTGYAEGWALYAEQLAWELDWYKDDPYGNLGRLQYEAFRAARLVVDTGIHAKKWTYGQALIYMKENVGFDPSVVNLEHEVSRYIAWPGQATAYKIGMLKILELRQKAMDALGDQFDTKEFHRIILGNGSMPLDILEKVVQDYIDAKLGNPCTFYSYPMFKPASCTVFTASIGDTVLFGNNEDWNDKSTYIWFVPASEIQYGGVYVGFGDYHAQGGMNDQGLCFDANAIPESKMKSHPERLSTINFARRALQQCATVEEVAQLIELYDLSGLGRAQFLFADRTGNAIIMCPGTDGEMKAIRKEGVYQVTTNFNVLSPRLGGHPCWRYNAAVGMLKKIEDENDLTVEYFESILKAVFQRYTTYSTIYDPVDSTVYLYNWHNFDEVVVFNLEEELEKGYHTYYIPLLFPREPEETKEPEMSLSEKTQESEESPGDSAAPAPEPVTSSAPSFNIFYAFLIAVIIVFIAVVAAVLKKKQ